jgi:uncharacterized protein (DUF433 family)
MMEVSMNAKDVLSSDPEIVSGAVVFKGTRVPVDVLFVHLAAGDSLDVFLRDFPTVDRAQAQAVLQLAADDLKGFFRKKAA